jgi:hypothetical protein
MIAFLVFAARRFVRASSTEAEHGLIIATPLRHFALISKKGIGEERAVFSVSCLGAARFFRIWGLDQEYMDRIVHQLQTQVTGNGAMGFMHQW